MPSQLTKVGKLIKKVVFTVGKGFQFSVLFKEGVFVNHSFHNFLKTILYNGNIILIELWHQEGHEWE